MTIQAGPKTAAKMSNKFSDHLPTDVSDNLKPSQCCSFTLHLRLSSPVFSKTHFSLENVSFSESVWPNLKTNLGDRCNDIYSTQYNPILSDMFLDITMTSLTTLSYSLALAGIKPTSVSINEMCVILE